MIKIEDVQPGNSYACKFKVKNIPLDEFGRPGGMLSLADIPVKKYGDYEGVGILMARDSESRHVKLQDEKSQKEFVVPFEDIWDIDTIEWTDPFDPKNQ